MFLEQICPKKSPNFSCKKCAYATSNKKDYTKHLSTRKHLLSAALNSLEHNLSPPPPADYLCTRCNKKYKSRNGLWYHEQKCTQPSSDIISTVTNAPVRDHVLIIELLKQNQEFKDLILDQNEKMMEINKQMQDQHQDQNKNMMELASKVGNTTNNNIKQQNNFNLQVFLNETCKDAVDINDFIKNLPVSFKQLENINQNGYVAGITDVILSQLKTMEITKRPLHCTDLKRDTMYIKEANEWVKDNDENTKMTQIFRRIAKKNVSYLHDWSDKNPDSLVTDTKENTFLINVLLHSLGVIGDAQIKLDNKVLKNISKIVHVGRNICE